MSSDFISMRTQDFAVQYQSLSDDALTQLASEGGLRPEADIALRTEMQKRSIGLKEVRSLRAQQKKAKLQIQVGNNPYSYQGTGLRLRGDKVLTESDRNKGITVVTRWIILLLWPSIPLGSYRVKQHTDGGKPEIVGKVPLQWDQVLNGWKVAALIAALILLAFAGTVIVTIWWATTHH